MFEGGSLASPPCQHHPRLDCRNQSGQQHQQHHQPRKSGTTMTENNHPSPATSEGLQVRSSAPERETDVPSVQKIRLTGILAVVGPQKSTPSAKKKSVARLIKYHQAKKLEMRRWTTALLTGPSQRFRLAKPSHAEEVVPISTKHISRPPAAFGFEMKINLRSKGKEAYACNA